MLKIYKEKELNIPSVTTKYRIQLRLTEHKNKVFLKGKQKRQSKIFISTY